MTYSFRRIIIVNRQEFSSNFLRMEAELVSEEAAVPVLDTQEEEELSVNISNRGGLAGFWDKFRDKIIELFREEEDAKFNGR